MGPSLIPQQQITVLYYSISIITNWIVPNYVHINVLCGWFGRLRIYEVEIIYEDYNVFVIQAPAYHIALEAILVSWIAYLLFFSKQFRPSSKHDKLTKEASV